MYVWPWTRCQERTLTFPDKMTSTVIDGFKMFSSKRLKIYRVFFVQIEIIEKPVTPFEIMASKVLDPKTLSVGIIGFTGWFLIKFDFILRKFI